MFPMIHLKRLLKMMKKSCVYRHFGEIDYQNIMNLNSNSCIRLFSFITLSPQKRKI